MELYSVAARIISRLRFLHSHADALAASPSLKEGSNESGYYTHSCVFQYSGFRDSHVERVLIVEVP